MNAALICAAVNLLQDTEEQHSTGCNAEDTPVVAKTTDSTPAAANNNAEYAPALATANSIERTTRRRSTHMALHRRASCYVRAISTPSPHHN